MSGVNLRTVFAFAREMHSKHPSIGNIQYGKEFVEFMEFVGKNEI
jgi:hypothetical protein